MKTFFTILLCIAVFLIFPACGDDDDDEIAEADSDDDNDDNDNDEIAFPFPPGFLFGAATAGFQCDMGCPTLDEASCTDTASDWYQFVTNPQTVAHPLSFVAGEDPAVVGPGHWELYEDDFDLARDELHSNAFRMSLEWSRIFPQSTVGVEGTEALREIADADALAHYHAVFAALRERGITPLVTLHHYTLPTWLHDGVGCTLDFRRCTARGWLDRERAVTEIAKYAGFAAREFGAEVDLWATQNEPFAVLLSGYLMPTPTRTNPPLRLVDDASFKTAFLAMIEAHARMYDAVHSADVYDADNNGEAASVGLVYAIAPFRPLDPNNPWDVSAAENGFYLWNSAFLNAACSGELDANLDGESQYRDDLDGRMDWLGLNYKVVVKLAGLPFPLIPWVSPLSNFNPLSLDMSLVDPSALYDMAMWLTETYGLPIYVTENNGQHVPRGDIDTEIRLVVENLSWLARAVEDGVDARGYFYWSFMDNYEWNHGTSIRLGLYRVEPDDPTKQRHARETVEVFSAIAQAGGVPADLAARFPIAK
ncbi:MAG: family 1 glycosylhydrolase [Candidatus Lernaella stagnicola]|nr:family 1 glycosylhydrolase [Candidatus Lernaella stagnicola]